MKDVTVSYEPQASFFQYLVRIGDFNYAYPSVDEAPRGCWFDDASPPDAPVTYADPPNERVKALIKAWGADGSGSHLMLLAEELQEQFPEAMDLIQREYLKVSS